MNILKIIQDNAERTANKSGLSIVEIARKAGISISSLRPLLKELHKEKKIIAREGVNNTLFFSNQQLEKS